MLATFGALLLSSLKSVAPPAKETYKGEEANDRDADPCGSAIGPTRNERFQA
jgi:hypothetical protein